MKYREELRELLQAQLDISRSEGDVLMVMRIRRVLRNERLFKRLHRKAKKAVKAEGGDWMDWLMNGGLEDLIKWITLLIELFG